MSVRSIEMLQRYLRRLCDEAVPPEDAVLLSRFVAAKDREAFELLIARHGPMVLGTARRLVDNTHDAEDVFQAVFLSLARLAKTIRQGCALPAWLHKTTCRIAAKVRKNRVTGSKEPPPEPCDNIDPEARLVWQEVRQALDEELQHLPERLRSPLLLCYLSGLARDEAAKQLGWSLGTLKKRLEEGRKSLRIRLEKRGIAPVALALAVLTPQALQAAVSQSLFESTLSVIFSAAAGVPAAISAVVLGSTTTMKGVAMKSILGLIAAIALGVGIYVGTGQADGPQKPEQKKDQVKPVAGDQGVPMEDPRPAGATLRFGTSRFRLGLSIETIAVSRDGKIAIAANSNYNHGPRATQVFDLASGRALYAIGASDAGMIEAAAISPDGKTIVTEQDFSLRIRDAANGKELRKITLQRSNSFSVNGVLAFTPDGKAIAVTTDGKVIHLVDFKSGKIIRDFAHGAAVDGIAFSQDGKWMAAGSNEHDKGNYFARLWDVETGIEIRRFMHGSTGYGLRSMAFSPDAKWLATCGDTGEMKLFDVDSGKLHKTFPKNGGRTKLGTVAFSPDSKTVAVAGESIRLFDTTTLEERLRINRDARGLHFTEDGKFLTGAINGAIHRWDTTTGKARTPESAGNSVVEQILLTPDGSRVFTRGQYEAHLWDASTAKHLRHIPVPWQGSIALSPDGKFLTWSVADSSVEYTLPAEPRATYTGNRLKLYDIANDRFVDRFPGFKGNAQTLMFAPDGKTLITVDHIHSAVRIWDVAGGKELRSFPLVRDNEKRITPYYVWSASLSPDGATLAVTYQRADNTTRIFGAYSVRLYDVAKGTERQELGGHLYSVSPPAFSPDGKLLVTASPALSDFFQKQLKMLPNQVYVWDVATGKRVAPLPDGLPTGAMVAAFSPDGRTLALARGVDFGGSAELLDAAGAVQLYETATWTVRTEFRGDQGRVTALTFAPNGRLLIGGADTTVLAWDIRPPRVAAAVSLDKAWNDLAAKEASESFKSEGKFLAAPADAVKLFAEKIKPAEPLDPKRVQLLLTDLGSEQFAVRDAASKALERLDRQANPYLESALKDAKTLEHRARLKRIIDRRLAAPITSEQLRQMRSVMVLELIGDVESKNLLKKWAGGPVGALLTMEASNALKRLETVSKAHP